jgi:membrane associated rhomboid family serine protease
MANQIMSVLKLKCPKCGKGDMFCNKSTYQFKGFFDMNECCPYCKQDFLIEPGFYYGAMYVSYAFTIALTIATFVAMSVLNVFSIGAFIIADIIVLLVTLPYVFKVSRSFWLTLMVKPDDKELSNNV